MKKAIVIGAGIGGLSSAIRLASRGVDVTVFEAAAQPGGKAGQFTQDGFRFDRGPSLFTLPSQLDELFYEAGVNPNDYYSYKKLPVITKYFYPDNTVLNAWAQPEKLAQEMQDKFGEPKEGVHQFLSAQEEVYNLTADIFLRNSMKNIPWLKASRFFWDVRVISKLNAFRTMARVNENQFKSPKTAMLFNRYATYNGSNPFKAPGTLNVIAHLEHNIGAYFMHGGMYGVTQALYQLACDKGVSFCFNTPVTKILREKNQVVGIATASAQHKANIVVTNMDATYTYQKLLDNYKKPLRLSKEEKSSSALIFYWGMKGSYPSLDVHNIFFTSDYRREFNTMAEGEVGDDPTIYVYISKKAEESDAPEGCENWFVMINVPYDQGQDWDAITKRVRKQIEKRLSKHTGVDVAKNRLMERVWTPVGIDKDTLSHKGALYGGSSNSMLSAFLRHQNDNASIKGLYFVGGSVHPGGGVPLCLLSSAIAVKRMNHHGLFA